MTKRELEHLKSDYQYCYGQMLRVLKSKDEEAIKKEYEFIGGCHRMTCVILEVGKKTAYAQEIVTEWENEVIAEWENAEKEGRSPKMIWSEF